MSGQLAKQNAITVRGSAQTIAEYLNYGINSILFQRGIYPPEDFESKQHYGLTILMSKDSRIQEFIGKIIAQTEEWISKDLLEKISIIITDVRTKECLECWDFKVKFEDPGNYDNTDIHNPVSFKDTKRVQNEIRDVMRQISATVSYLPLLDCVCTFDLLIYARQECEIPDTWDETEGVYIQNSQAVNLRSFSTGLHKVQTIVNYKMT